jgi:hypothetical protein
VPAEEPAPVETPAPAEEPIAEAASVVEEPVAEPPLEPYAFFTAPAPVAEQEAPPFLAAEPVAEAPVEAVAVPVEPEFAASPTEWEQPPAEVEAQVPVADAPVEDWAAATEAALQAAEAALQVAEAAPQVPETPQMAEALPELAAEAAPEASEEAEPPAAAESPSEAPESWEETAALVEAAGPIEISDSVVVVTPQVLEEPVPGSGWEPSAIFVEEEVELEELLPVVADDVKPYEGPEIAKSETTVDGEWELPGWPETAAEEAPEETPAEYRATVAEPEVAPALGEDLKTRIEETRRRIREELEKPFAAVDREAPVAPPPLTPAAEQPPALAQPVIGEPMRTDVITSNGNGDSHEARAAAADDNGSDYDAMRARIELTRSRLKAKAFDAMMAGESALLGRDSDDSAPWSRPAATFDSEIERTVDSTLREEDQ